MQLKKVTTSSKELRTLLFSHNFLQAFLSFQLVSAWFCNLAHRTPIRSQRTKNNITEKIMNKHNKTRTNSKNGEALKKREKTTKTNENK